MTQRNFCLSIAQLQYTVNPYALLPAVAEAAAVGAVAAAAVAAAVAVAALHSSAVIRNDPISENKVRKMGIR